ncbi:Mitochondrial 37S ribosomal protein S27 [Smittium culicis]|uniref:Small ribosomal subunit protein mS33 n=1 Tax=Smittium culicis TaxID=133412 RepID=A0A1R1YBN6_9FUNG|nr:Mitochondrial 37S ribosomal protein S27 [Smittium culicis]
MSSGGLAAKRLLISKISSNIFNQGYNPSNTRSGRKILNKKPSSISIGSYYPPDELYESSKFKHFRDKFKDMKFQPVDFEEIDRLQKVDALRRRGKGAPKKETEKRHGKKK